MKFSECGFSLSPEKSIHKEIALFMQIAEEKNQDMIFDLPKNVWRIDSNVRVKKVANKIIDFCDVPFLVKEGLLEGAFNYGIVQQTEMLNMNIYSNNYTNKPIWGNDGIRIDEGFGVKMTGCVAGFGDSVIRYQHSFAVPTVGKQITNIEDGVVLSVGRDKLSKLYFIVIGEYLYKDLIGINVAIGDIVPKGQPIGYDCTSKSCSLWLKGMSLQGYQFSTSFAGAKYLLSEDCNINLSSSFKMASNSTDAGRHIIRRSKFTGEFAQSVIQMQSSSNCLIYDVDIEGFNSGPAISSMLNVGEQPMLNVDGLTAYDVRIKGVRPTSPAIIFSDRGQSTESRPLTGNTLDKITIEGGSCLFQLNLGHYNAFRATNIKGNVERNSMLINTQSMNNSIIRDIECNKGIETNARFGKGSGNDIQVTGDGPSSGYWLAGTYYNGKRCSMSGTAKDLKKLWK